MNFSQKIDVYQVVFIAFIIGVALAEYLTINALLLWSLIISFVFLGTKLRYLVLLAMVSLIFGVMRYNLSLPLSSPDKIWFYNGKQITFEGTVAGLPEINNNQQKFVANIKIVDQLPVSGKVLISADIYPPYQAADSLLISCLLKSPERKTQSSLSFARYLAKDNIYSVCSFPKITWLKSSDNKLYNLFYKFKSSIILYSIRNLPEPAASLFIALIIGSRQGIPIELSDSFKITGTAHLIAISGSHIVIIIMILEKMFSFFYLSRRQIFWASSLILFFYLGLIAFPASAVRAVIMGWLGLLAYQLGRVNQPGRTLLLAAVIMILFNPKILLSDAGFQLSFLAVLGIAYFSPFWQKIFSRWPSFFGFKDSLVMTLSAQVTTTPLLLFSFNRLSLISPLANLLVVPIFPYLILSGLSALVLNFLFFNLPTFFYWPVMVALNYTIIIVDNLAKLPWASISFS
ncbi:MAG: ComEC/Rec2 family competence protein [Patescibacteria group bacterium]|nr:ComEC/Rec2 family competence protein [Patescibacteria group bacterium]